MSAILIVLLIYMDYTLEELKTLIAPIAEKYGVERVYLFGSRARGDNTSESDYDFCIVPDKGMSLIKLSGFLLDLKESLDSEVDIVCEDSIDPEFLRSISEDRRILYEI